MQPIYVERCIFWSNISQIFSTATKIYIALPCLSWSYMDHIYLTPYSKMKVKLATQVLSRSVSVSMEESGNEGVLGTACTVLYDDEWFLWLYKCEVTDWTCQEKKSFHQTIHLPRWRAIHIAETCLPAVPGELEEVYPCTPRKVFKLKQVKTTFLNLSSIKHVVCALFRLYHRMNQLAWTTIYVFLLKI